MNPKPNPIERLYLKEEQLKEMSEMWPDEQEHPLVIQLRKWRDATPGPWCVFTDPNERTKVLIGTEGHTLLELVAEGRSEDQESVVHTRNTIELTTALHFWEITGWKAVFVGQKADNEKAIEACRVLENTSQDMLARIKEALDELS